MRLSCSASSFFSSSATSSIASFATYSTSSSLIFIRKGDLLDPRCSPRLIHFRQQLRAHPDELLAPDLIWDVDDDARAVNGCDRRCTRQLRPDHGGPKLS